MTRATWLILAGSASLHACTATPQHRLPDGAWASEVDAGKVSTVDRWALDHGATVIWLKYPQKHKAGSGD